MSKMADFFIDVCDALCISYDIDTLTCRQLDSVNSCARMIVHEREEYSDPHTYHTGIELMELWTFFREMHPGGYSRKDIHFSVKQNLIEHADCGALLDSDAVY